jgi:hypothetical protein
MRMKKTVLIAFAFLFALGLAMPPAAEARVFVHAGFGCCFGAFGYPYYPYYGPYYDPYYVAPPTVVYTVPPPPTVVYQQPAPAAYQQPAPPPAYAAGPAPAAVAASQPPSAAFVDSQGRTCRHVQITSSINTICLQPDGSWRTVQ